MRDLSREIKLLCPVCGNDQFSKEDDSFEDSDERANFICSDCKHKFIKAELLESNQELIDININEVTKEYIKEFNKDFEKDLRKIFK